MPRGVSKNSLGSDAVEIYEEIQLNEEIREKPKLISKPTDFDLMHLQRLHFSSRATTAVTTHLYHKMRFYIFPPYHSLTTDRDFYLIQRF